MNIGNKVRFLHSKGEGIVRKIIDQKTVDVEIEDGFVVPFLKSDLVVVASDESMITGEQVKGGTPSSSTSSKGNLWFAFVPFNDKVFSVYLINDSNEEVLYTLHESKSGNTEGIASGILRSGTTGKVAEASVANFEEWPEWIVQVLFYRDGTGNLKLPLSKNFKLKANSFFKNKQNIPLLQKEGHAFRIDDTQGVKINASQMTESMFSSSAEKETPKLTRPPQEIDLHIEKLRPDFASLSNSEMLKTQLAHFEKNLDNGIATGMDEIIFIHGVGNGVLRQELHKLLSKNKGIKFFQDARKEKFGYGATLVRIK